MVECASFRLDDLAAIIAARSQSSAERSYTKSLLEAGMPRAAKKFGEEAVETVIAAIGQDDRALVSECADVLYHLLVLLQLRGVSIGDVMDELHARTRQSGHQEKASRQPAATP
jgi:phosphoribosyl-ATP pyrophosphohydrolase